MCFTVENPVEVELRSVLQSESSLVGCTHVTSYSKEYCLCTALHKQVTSDVFVRVGGPEPPDEAEKKAKIAVLIQSGNVIVDNAWIWRADHTLGGEGTKRKRVFCAVLYYKCSFY